MSWLFSRVLVEEFWGGGCSDGEQSAPSSGSLIPQAYCAPDKMTVFSCLSRFGMTYKPLTENLGEELLTLYQAAFRARTFLPQEKAQELTESAAECGEKWRGSFTKYDHDLSLWRTHQCSLFEDSEPYLETWPRWGLMRNGECWELTSPVLTINEIESGLLPTMLATDWKGGTTSARKDNGKQRFDQWRDYIKLKHGMTYPHPIHSEIRMGWPQGWTDLKPLEMDKFRKLPLLPGQSFQVNRSE